MGCNGLKWIIYGVFYIHALQTALRFFFFVPFLVFFLCLMGKLTAHGYKWMNIIGKCQCPDPLRDYLAKAKPDCSNLILAIF